MNYQKKLLTCIVAVFFICSGAFVCSAQDDCYNRSPAWMLELLSTQWNQGSKQEIIQKAKAEDKYIFLFVGRPCCPYCQAAMTSTTQATGVQTVWANGYIKWFSYYDYTPVGAHPDVKEYVKNFVAQPCAFPYFVVFDPFNPDMVIASSCATTTGSFIYNMINIHLEPNNKLTWYTEAQALQLANVQNKLVFKFIGRGTSHYSREMMDLLGKEPIKSLLEEKFILTFTEQTAPIVWPTSEGEDAPTPPYITIIDPEKPGQNQTDWGAHAYENLLDMLEGAVTSNEDISLPQDNNVFINKNTLYVTNLTGAENIQIFTVTGQQVYSFNKTEFQATVDASQFPKGLLIVRSSLGWNAKILNR